MRNDHKLSFENQYCLLRPEVHWYCRAAVQHLARSAITGVVRSRHPHTGSTQVLWWEKPKLVTSLSLWEFWAWKDSSAGPPKWYPGAAVCQAQQASATNGEPLGQIELKGETNTCVYGLWETLTLKTDKTRRQQGKKKCKWSPFLREAAMTRTQ